MIELTKLTNEKFYLNPNLIEVIEITPDTMITMTNGKKYYALENVHDIIKKIEAFYQRILPIIHRTDCCVPSDDSENN
jgi:flagellar protein FlbD